MRIRIAGLLALLWLLALSERANAQTPTGPAPTPLALTQVEATDCDRWMISEEYDTDCGYVLTPERHGDPAGPTIRIAYLRLHSAAREPGAPVVFLAGGPGDSGINGLSSSARLVDALLATRDVLTFDQRGAGYSIPSLNCMEWMDAAQELPLENASDEEVAGCRDYWTDQGYDVSAYTTQESAADVVNALRALGYAQAVLLGESYGAKLAQIIMRTAPDVVAAAVLDGVVPVELNQEVEQLPKMDFALDRAFALCAADQACATYYPDLENRFYALVARLDDEPLTLTMTQGGESWEETVYGIDLITAMFVHLIQGASALTDFPYRVTQVEMGDTTYLTQLYASGNWVDPLWGTGMNLTIHCGEEVLLATEADFAAALAAYPLLEAAQMRTYPTEYADLRAECMLWGAEPASPDYAQPVTSTLPSLILQGGLDFQTPLPWAIQLQTTLPNSKLVYLPTSGHITTYATACGAQIATQFIVDPAAPLDTSCIDALAAVRFYAPQLNLDVPTRPVIIPAQEDGEIGATVLPTSWRQDAQNPAFFGPTTADQGLFFLAVENERGPLSDLLRVLAETEEGEVETWTTGDLTWDVLVVPNSSTGAAVYAARRQAGVVYTVVMQGYFINFAAALGQIFQPALAAHRIGDEALGLFQAVRLEFPDKNVVIHTLLQPDWVAVPGSPLVYGDPTGLIDVTVDVLDRGVIAAQLAGEITGEEEPSIEHIIVGERTWAMFVSYDEAGTYVHALNQERRGAYMLTLGLYGAYANAWRDGLDILYPMLVGFDVTRR